MNGRGWVCMGAMGLGRTGEQKNKVSKDTNGLGGEVFGACMAGKFPGKTHVMCA